MRKFRTFGAYVLVFALYLGVIALADRGWGIGLALVALAAFLGGAVHLIRKLSIVKVAFWIVGGLLAYSMYLAMQENGHGNEAVLLVLLVAAYPAARWISDLFTPLEPRLSLPQLRLLPSLMISAAIIIFWTIKAGGHLILVEPSSMKARSSPGESQSRRVPCPLADEEHIQWAMKAQGLPREWAIRYLCAASMQEELEVLKQYYYSQGPDGVARWNARWQKSLHDADDAIWRAGLSPSGIPLLLPEHQTNDRTWTEKVMGEHCRQDWSNDYRMQEFCLEQQRKALATLERGKPSDIGEKEFRAVRTKCADDWPTDLNMRAFCEQQQYDSVRQMRRSEVTISGAETPQVSSTSSPPPIENRTPASTSAPPRPAPSTGEPSNASRTSGLSAPDVIVSPQESRSDGTVAVPPAGISETRPTPLVPQLTSIQIPAGAILEIRTVDPIDSALNHTGDIVSGSLAAAIAINNELVVPRGAGVYVRLLRVRQLQNSSEVRLVLDHLIHQGKSYPLASTSFDVYAPSRSRQGAGVEITIRGKYIHIPPETTIKFQLVQPIRITGTPVQAPPV